jgi:hypothetical protein
MTIIARYPALAVAIPIGLVLAAADLIGGGSVQRAAVSLSIVAVYAIAVTLLGRRSETLSTLSGRPVDERWEHINLEACTWSLAASAIVVLVGFAVTSATGGDSIPYALMGSVIALTYVGSLIVLRARH